MLSKSSFGFGHLLDYHKCTFNNMNIDTIKRYNSIGSYL